MSGARVDWSAGWWRIRLSGRGFIVRPGKLEAELREALEVEHPSAKKRAAQKKTAAARRISAQRHNEETAEIRRQVFERAGGFCEHPDCSQRVTEATGHMDHFFGRGKVPQRVSNCWALCIICDRAKTNNHPEAAYWLWQFIRFANLRGYGREVEMAQRRLDAITLTRGGGNT